MKTAISIPDVIYKSAEKLAKRFKQSRSELYSKAVKNSVESYQNDALTTKLNEVYSSEASHSDPVLDS